MSVATGNPNGRPTKCTPELVEQAWQYLKDFKEVHKHAIASNAGLAIVLNVAESSIYLWAKEPQSGFSEILEAIKTQQLFGLMDGGLKHELNSSITRVLLGKHGIYEKTETDITANLNLSATSTDQLKAHIQALLDKAKVTP